MGLFIRYLILFSYVICSTNAWYADVSLFDWFWPKNEGSRKEIGSDTPLIAVPFETKTDDEKFLEEATRFTDVIKSSPLDSCQHKVVLKLKTSCASMTEEELAKMSVNLLNCQSAVDGRQIFPCSSSMSLKECTQKMDATMWNAYHMMNNRARAVCLAARRSQFQALSEMTVNKLMSAAQSQIKKMNSMVESQDRLERLTLGTINLVEKGNIEILNQQDQLKTSQVGLHDFISHNLRELVKEKALIAAGHKELSKMTENIKSKMDETSKQLDWESSERAVQHKQLLADIGAIQKVTKEIFDRIDESTDRLLLQHAEAVNKYEEAMQNLAKINETIFSLLKVVDVTRTEIDEKFSSVESFLNNNGIQIGKMAAIVYHIAYLLVGMLFASFLNFSTLARIILTVLVPLNLYASYTERTELALDYAQMTGVLMGTALFIAVINRFMKPTESASSIEYRRNGNDYTKLSDEPVSGLRRKLGEARGFFQKLISYFRSRIPSNHRSSRSDSYEKENSYGKPYRNGSEAEYEEDNTYYLPRVNNFSVSSHELVRDWLRTAPTSPSELSNNQKLCSAISRSSRRRCRNVSSRGSDYCFRHGNSEMS